MARICPLYSGSTGNCTYIGTENTGILIDAGASGKGIKEGLLRVGADFDKIDAIAITHCHNDHIMGIKTVLRRTNAMLIAREETLEALLKKDLIPCETKLEAIENTVSVGDMQLSSFATSHDTLGSCGYTVNFENGKKFSLCTDTGIITPEISLAIKGSDAVLIESNHDIEMLKNGPYPPLLKVRIMSEKGHISNAVCAGEVKKLFESGTTRFILGHLSLNNNTKELALGTSEAALMDLGAKIGQDYILTVASPKNNGATVI